MFGAADAILLNMARRGGAQLELEALGGGYEVKV